MRAARLILCCSIREGGSLLRAGLFPGAWCAPAEEIVEWKEWTYNRHPTHEGEADGVRCSCSK